MRRPSRPVLAGSAVATAGVTAAALGLAATRRWARAQDPTSGEPLYLPDGADLVVHSPDGAELATRVAGAGEAGGATFVLSHCWTGDRRVWGPVARRLVDRGHRVVLYDQRGHGASTIGKDGLTLDALADDLCAVLDQVDVCDAVVAGHSMGGMAAQAFAVRHPDVLHARVRALGLVATACDHAGIGGLFARVATWAVGSSRANRLLSSRRFGPALVRGSVGRRPVSSHLQAVRETYVATEPATRATLLTAMGAMDFSNALKAVDLPVVVAVGTHDRLTPPARSRHLASVLPRARLELIADAGHMLPAEAPDRVTELLVGLAGRG